MGSKATLAAEDVRFARTIERLQKIICSELNKIAIVHLYTQGFDDADLVDFDLELQNPSMIHEQEKLELMTQRTELARTMMEDKIVSREWIYENIFQFNDEEKQEIFQQMVEDQKQKFRFEQIETEGNDPTESGQKADENGEMAEVGEWGGSEKDPYRYQMNAHKSSADDAKDATKYDKERYGKRNFKHKSPLHPGKGATLMKSEMLNRIKQQFGKKDISKTSILNEDAIFDDTK